MPVDLAAVAHRPWPLPAGRAVMRMTWSELLFAHWRAAPEAVRPLLPAGLELDVRDGAAWVAVVPFRMSGVGLRCLPPLPGTRTFPELNVRTYVTRGGKPGVWFMSLDAASRLAVRGARAWFHLPYFDARMTCDADGGGVRYASDRTHRGAAAGAFRATYSAEGPVFAAAPGSLEHWLTERYCLYSDGGGGRILRGEIHHAPWPLRRARCAITENSMLAAGGAALPPGASPLSPDHLLFAPRIDVVAWAPRPA